MCVLLSDNLEADDIRLELHVLGDPILIASVVHRIKHLAADRMVVNATASAGLLEGAVRWCTFAAERLGKDVAPHGGSGADGAKALIAGPVVLMPEPNVERPEVGLDPGVLRGRVVPGIATALVVAIKHDNVLVVVHHVLHCGLDALEAGADDGCDVRPRVARVLEVREPADDRVGGHGLVILQGTFLGGEDRDLCCVLPIGKDACDGLLQDLHRHALLDRELKLLVRVFDLECNQVVVGGDLPLGSLVQLLVLVSGEHQHVTLKLVEERIPLLAGIAEIILPNLRVHLGEVAEVVCLQQVLAVVLKRGLALLRE
mmetsp:Transcript_33956/g.101282  ORF Transcript_33956/g.101282 Transcript_33956/m.101282 type:complete len:315 (+) Transcript_33956:1678-2622(+)